MREPARDGVTGDVTGVRGGEEEERGNGINKNK